MKIYHNPRCRKSREGVQYLTDKKLNFEIFDYRIFNIFTATYNFIC